MSKDLHDQLVDAYLEYFALNQWWQSKRSERSYYRTQQKIRHIRALTKQLEAENRQIFQNRPRPKGGVS